MRKNYYRLLAFSGLLIVCSLQLTSAQDKASREALWQNYEVPRAPFKRYVSPANSFILRVPTSWQQLGTDLHFRGENEIEFKVVIEKVPDGIGLKSYMAAMLQNLRNLPGGVDALSVRRTQISGLEARELSFEMEDAKGDSSHRHLWLVANGAEALTFLFITPDAKEAENLPYFKGIMQSVVIPDRRLFYGEFDYLRAKIVTQNLSATVDEVQSLVASFEGQNAVERETAVGRLAKIFSATPEVALDLLLDRRPFVRAFVVRAMALSGNQRLRDFLIREVGDPDPFVAAQAAQTVAAMPDIVELIRKPEQGFLFHQDKLLRVGALLDVQTRAQVAAELFKMKTSVVLEGLDFQMQLHNPGRSQTPPPPPPPPAAAVKAKPKSGAAPRSLGAINVNASKSAAGGRRTAPRKAGGDLNAQFLALNLAGTVPVALLKIPFAEISASGDERLINFALEVAYDRGELLPVEALYKLLEAPEHRLLAILNLGQSAGPADLVKIESHIRKLSAKRPESKNSQTPGGAAAAENRLLVISDAVAVEQLRMALKKIQLREQLAKADKETRAALLRAALSDKQLTDWVWLEYWRNESEGAYSYAQSPTRIGKAVGRNQAGTQISPFGENLFPENVTLYAALPEPGEALGRLGDSLSNMQMNTAREQADFLVMFTGLRDALMATLGAKSEDYFLDAAGIKADAPMAMASWTAENAPRGTPMAQRSAVVLRVSDRDKFERALTVYQSALGNFQSFPAYLSAVSRFIGLVPALLPYMASMVLEDAPKSPRPISTNHRLLGFDECKGYPVKVFEQRELKENGLMKHNRIYVAYLQDTALLTPDWYSLRDALTRLETKGPSLAANAAFKRALANDGDIVYMSDAGAALDLLVGRQRSETAERVSESGALKISNTAWQSIYQLVFKNSEWAKPLKPFQAQELTAPRELLPKSTLVYLFLKLDAGLAWREWSRDFLSPEELTSFQSNWAMDFEKEVLPELEGEAGASLLNFPKLETAEWNWALFFKLRGSKLDNAFQEGRLFKQAGKRSARLKFGSAELVATVKNGYLIFTDSEASVERFDAKEKLHSTRDFAKTVTHTPANVVAFGGYNLESAIADLEISGKDPNTRDAMGRFISLARAFHSQNFYAAMDAQTLNAQLSVSLAREGRYSVAELSQMSKGFDLAYAVVEARGLPIVDQSRIDSLKLRIRARSQGVIDRIKENIDSDAQRVEKQANDSLMLTLRPRRGTVRQKTLIPVSGAAFADSLKPTRQIRSDDANVIAKAREIVGDEKDAWAVARKLSDWTYKNLQWKKVDDADAAQTLASRQADCLEFSELFIAMARSLGLPARLVTGFAHSGGSFGGHAWVEVYAGEWIELDPTWGTDFVDATHIRAESAELLSYAVLNLIEMETLEMTRTTPDFQRDPTRLVEKICQEFLADSAEKDGTLSLALDMKVLADHLMGAGAWEAMSEKEREQFSSTHGSLLDSLVELFPAEASQHTIRVLKTRVEGDRAEVLAIRGWSHSDEMLFQFKLARKGDAWVLLEIVLLDDGFNTIAETLRPAVQAIADQRKGQRRQGSHYSPLRRAMSVWESDKKTAMEIIEQGLKASPDDQPLRLFKSKLLLYTALLVDWEEESDAQKAEAKKAEQRNLREAARVILESLIGEGRTYAPALLELGDFYESEEAQKAEALYQRYARAIPEDPRSWQRLAALHQGKNEPEKALAGFRAAIERDPRNSVLYADQAEFLVTLKRYEEAMKLIDEGEKYADPDENLFADLLWSLEEHLQAVEALAASQPQRMATNARANVNLAYLMIRQRRAAEALPHLKRAIDIDPKNFAARIALSDAHLQLKNWSAVLTATRDALQLDAQSAEAYYNRACALARLNRKAEAMQALQKAIELDEDLLYQLEEDEDLKLLAPLPAFKKLLKQLQEASGDETIKQ